jgi:hypothetical protein
MSRYELLSEIKINDEIPVKKYLFPATGIKIYLAEVSSPVTNSYLALGKNFSIISQFVSEKHDGKFSFFSLFAVTETDNNCGLPHTLEHLVFLGSEEYPYKGVLDLLANRSLANGTSM